MPTLAELARHFLILSFLAFGGANATLPEIHRLVVEQNQWLAADIFSDLFAISQAAPGPNLLLISLIGLQLSGISGFLVTTLAFCLPSSLLMYSFDRWWRKSEAGKWRTAVEESVGPLSSGLVLSSGWLIATSTVPVGFPPLLLLTAATSYLTMTRNWHPLWWIAVGAGLGLSGLV